MTLDRDDVATFDRQTIKVVVAVLIGGLAVLLDSTIVSVALKSLATDLGASITTIQWITTAYLLAVGVTVPLAVWAQARWGGKRLWLGGLVLFGVGSIAASLAGSAGLLIAARVLQGVGGGILMPLMATLPLQAARGRVTGRMIATVSLPMLIGPMLGPVIGGLILHWLSWRWLFWVNVPLVVVGFVAAARALPGRDELERRTLDVLGAVLLPPGLVGMLYGLSQVSSAGGFGHTKVLVPLLAGAALVAGFAVHAVRRGPDALVDVRLLARRQVASSCAVLFLAGAGLFAGMFLLPLFWQVSRGQSVLVAGAMMVPQGLGSLVSRTTAGRLTDTIGARGVSMAGVLVTAAATVPFAVAGPTTSAWWLGAALFVRGVGLGAVTIPVMAAVYQGLTGDDVAHASVLTRVPQQVGGSFGTAVLAVVLEHGLTTGTPAEAFDRAFWWAVGLSLVTALVVPTLPGRVAHGSPAALLDDVAV